MNAKVSKLINEQINKEFYSAYLYLDFANYYAAVGLDGFENWYHCLEKFREVPADAVHFGFPEQCRQIGRAHV